MNELLEQAQQLQNEGYSIREIGEELGISKSKVHRILKEGQQQDTSQDDNETIFEMSQDVSKVSKNTKRTVKIPNLSLLKTIQLL